MLCCCCCFLILTITYRHKNIFIFESWSKQMLIDFNTLLCCCCCFLILTIIDITKFFLFEMKFCAKFYDLRFLLCICKIDFYVWDYLRSWQQPRLSEDVKADTWFFWPKIEHWYYPWPCVAVHGRASALVCWSDNLEINQIKNNNCNNNSNIQKIDRIDRLN